MRCALAILLVLALPLSGAAQEPPDEAPPRPETETLLGSAVRHGGYGGPLHGVTWIGGNAVYLRGTRGAWVINLAEDHALNLGLGAYRTGSDFAPAAPVIPGAAQPELRTRYGGFEMEYVNRTRRLVHFSAQALVGSGEVRYRERDLPLDRTRASYFVVQPGVNVNLNVTNWFRLSGGALYRHAGEVTLEGVDGGHLSGPSSLLALRFGRF
jgi:hypothetical protein